MSYLIVFALLFLSGSPNLVGGEISKGALVLLSAFNVFKFKMTEFRVRLMVFITILFLIKAILSEDIDTVVLVLYFHLLFLITCPMRNYMYIKTILSALVALIFASIILSTYSLLTGYGDYIFSLANKGLPFLYAFKGVTTTPQALASLIILGIFACVVLEKKWSLRLYALLLPLTINRTGLVGVILMFLVRFPVIGLLVVCFALISGTMVIGQNAELLTTQTLTSRLQMVTEVFKEIKNSSLLSILFGSFDKPAFSISTNVHEVTYIENGFAFIFYYLGALGLFTYLVFILLGSIIIFRAHMPAKTRRITLTYFIFCTILVPNLTHEFLFLSFYFSIITIFSFIKVYQNARNIYN
ncbi:hypothetical protein K6Q96_04560 [Grimontia kaedaensis]|uniref:Uncharacterized protein n=1 Tax=Grimontia kaedaensis TaxID=2872157 RepID=A0ABY4WX16_9GAMM|nr:hypothetical protein [Grimontia kaedaensis]USH03292.1 hypothetical protein K6Q96_04560 [Grimontia kaedaensis]